MPGIDNLTQMGKPLSTEVAQGMQKKAAAKRKENNAKRKAVREMFEERLAQRGYKDIDEWMDNLAERAKENSKDMEFALAIMGERPKEQLEVSQEEPFKVTIETV